MKFETAIKKLNIKIKIIPVPRSISSSCGLCVRFDIADNNELQNIINMHKLEYSRIYTEI
ncbi:hypothetical protein J2Z76_002259 [Sedimentibacter acidaminivorans]|uniref:Putative Se/S carrier protein-like domain-containing protein n=2 Tax=Sedimentibacter acidaminivorans TaxID=913099 RepID=A0ABS4GFF7_9FIRM|nr:hypothetical protein [Sedimentibacter acidaminivorans]